MLNTIHESHDFIPVRPTYILQLHRDLLKRAGLSYGGHFKNVQNYINETRPDGSQFTRFTPVAPYETEAAIEAICASYEQTLSVDAVDGTDYISVMPTNLSFCLTEYTYERDRQFSLNDQTLAQKD